MDEKKKRFIGDRGDLARGLCRGLGGSRRSIDQRHLAENSAWSELLDDLAVPLDLDFAGADDVHLVALIARREDGLARLECCGREPCIGQKLEINRSHSHACSSCPLEGSRCTL